MPNSLGRPARLENHLFGSSASDLHSGESVGLAWNTRRRGLVLMPGKSARTRIARGTFLSMPVQTSFAFNEFIPSWNLQLDERNQGYKIEIRFFSRDGKWSPWFYFGTGGTFQGKTTKPRTTIKRWGRVLIDYATLEQPASMFQYRIQLQAT